jgi:hypothetical protein
VRARPHDCGSCQWADLSSTTSKRTFTGSPMMPLSVRLTAPSKRCWSQSLA